MTEDQHPQPIAFGQEPLADPTMKSIEVTLSLQANNQVSCRLDTNNLPFAEVRRQLILLRNALQWQIDNEKLCPLHSEQTRTN